jgi:ABC-type sulfate transport system substrate-binding protein
VPSLSILAEPPVTVVDKNVDRKRAPCRGPGLPRVPVHTPKARRSPAKHLLPAAGCQAAAKYASTFLKVNLFTIDDIFGGWAKAQKTHFNDGGSFDKVYTKK